MQNVSCQSYVSVRSKYSLQIFPKLCLGYNKCFTLNKMLCSPAEIERKRQEALQKLAKKKTSPIKTQSLLQSSSSASSSNPLLISSPRFTFKNNSPLSNQTKVFDHSKKPYEKPAQDQKPTIDFQGTNTVVHTKFCLISENRFDVTLSKFFPPVIEVFKTIPSRNYDPKTRIWSFHIRDYNLMLSSLNALRIQNVAVEKLPAFVVKCLKTPIQTLDVDFSRIDPELNQTLLPFQIEAVRFGIERNGRCLLADDMGLGKTFQALAIMNYYKEDWPLLIVTTASMKQQWDSTIANYLPSVSILHTQYMETGKDYIGDARILIVSHDLMSRHCDKILDRGFGCIIIDESHILKNYKTKITLSAVKLAKKAKRLLLVSGTPLLSRPKELFTQLNIIDPTFFGSFYQYADRYCNLTKTQFGSDASGKSNLNELELILNRKFMIRRTKDEVLSLLPKKTIEVVSLDVDLERFSDEDRRALKALARQYESERKSRNKNAILLSFFSETAKIKIPSVCSYILQIIDKKLPKFLVFAHHQKMLNAIENVLKAKNLNHIRIDGSTSSDQRQYFVKKFQNDPSVVCAILSITAANAGITLTAAQLVVFAELHWNPSILSQAESRAHRIGQDYPVHVQYLLAEGTADDSIWPLLQEKQKILSEVGLGNMTFENVTVKKQDSCQDVTEGLNIDTRGLDRTIVNTLDITSYFQSPEKKNGDNIDKVDEDEDNALNDGLDELLCNIDF